MFTILTGNVDEQLLDTDAVWAVRQKFEVRLWVIRINEASAHYRCDGAALVCNEQEDAELDPSAIPTQVHHRVTGPER